MPVPVIWFRLSCRPCCLLRPGRRRRRRRLAAVLCAASSDLPASACFPEHDHGWPLFSRARRPSPPPTPPVPDLPSSARVAVYSCKPCPSPYRATPAPPMLPCSTASCLRRAVTQSLLPPRSCPSLNTRRRAPSQPAGLPLIGSSATRRATLTSSKPPLRTREMAGMSPSCATSRTPPNPASSSGTTPAAWAPTRLAIGSLQDGVRLPSRAGPCWLCVSDSRRPATQPAPTPYPVESGKTRCRDRVPPSHTSVAFLWSACPPASGLVSVLG